ncbi:MAG: hypothetical protein KC800_17605 [Candidatus Eremiobacteraeota bacterium]|nr:hypothetical protein [Candidatus Eremiobacteraeota bacterium]
MLDWIWGCLVLASPAMVLTGLCTLLMTNPKKKVFYRGLVVGSVLSGALVGLLLFGLGAMLWFGFSDMPNGGNSIASGVVAVGGIVLLILGPIMGVLYSLFSTAGAFLFSAPLSEKVGVGKRFTRAVTGSLVGVNVGFAITNFVLKLF